MVALGEMCSTPSDHDHVAAAAARQGVEVVPVTLIDESLVREAEEEVGLGLRLIRLILPVVQEPFISQEAGEEILVERLDVGAIGGHNR